MVNDHDNLLQNHTINYSTFTKYTLSNGKTREQQTIEYSERGRLGAIFYGLCTQRRYIRG